MNDRCGGVESQGVSAPLDAAAPCPGSLGMRTGSELAAVYMSDRQRLVGLARTVIGSEDGADEIVQEAFARTLARWDDVRDKHDPLPYLRSVVLNLCRARGRRRVLPTTEAEDAPSAESVADVRARRSDVLAALRMLPHRQREVVALRYFGGLSTDETAAELGISAGSVKTHLHRALRTLAGSLEEHRHDR